MTGDRRKEVDKREVAGVLVKLTHCNLTFRPYNIWFLYDTATDKNRRLFLGMCPSCKKDVVSLVEERKIDGRVFVQIESGLKGQSLIDNAILKDDIIYSANEFKNKKGLPCGWVHGENKEIHNNKGEVIKIVQKQCDFFGQKRLIKEIAV